MGGQHVASMPLSAGACFVRAHRAGCGPSTLALAHISRALSCVWVRRPTMVRRGSHGESSWELLCAEPGQSNDKHPAHGTRGVSAARIVDSLG
eukprot:4451780-Prymnesium_polylepis.1